MVRHKDKESSKQKRDLKSLAQRKKAHETLNHPVFGKEQINGGVSNDVHSEFEGLDLPRFPRLGDLSNLHGLVVSR